MTKRLRATAGTAIALVALTVLLGGCEVLNRALTVHPANVMVQIEIADNAFSPSTIRIVPGTTVIWVNTDEVAHTVSAVNPAGRFSSGNLGTNQQFVYTFQEVGTYEYICTIHPSMTGTIIVEERQTEE